MGCSACRLRWLLVLVFATVAACGPAPNPSAVGTMTPGATPSAPAGSAGPTPAATPTGTASGALVKVYLALGFGPEAALVPVPRSADPSAAEPATALATLLAGPNDAERAAAPAPFSAIPSGTRLLGVTTDGSVAIVDLSGEFEAPAVDGLPTSLRLAQVVYTATQFPAVTAVRFSIDGQVVTVIGADRFPLDGPVGRDAFTDDLPAIFLDEPAWGATVSSPLRVAGLANAFEATFQVRIADAEGRGLASGAVMASCGTGCWGTFQETVPYAISAAGPGVVQVFELSAKDGAMINLREHPVWLLP